MKAISQFTLQGQYITTHKSIKAACNALSLPAWSISALSLVCRKKQVKRNNGRMVNMKSFHGYQFCFVGQEDTIIGYKESRGGLKNFKGNIPLLPNMVK